MSNFLENEYKECYSLLKHYDERHQSLVKFISGISGAIPSLLLSLYSLKNMDSIVFWKFTFIIFLVTTISLLALLMIMVQNRLYFIYPARQVNAIRTYHLAKEDNDFNNNQMYLSTTFNAFKFFSVHTLLNLFTSIQVGIFFGGSFFSYFTLNNCTYHPTIISFLSGGIFSLFVFSTSSYYLYRMSLYHPDRSIHRHT